MIDELSGQPIRVVLADDNKGMLDTITGLLETSSDLEVVGTAADGDSLVAVVAELNPQVAIVDISMPIKTGLVAAAEIRNLVPDVRIIFLTVHEDCDFVKAALEVGAAGYVVKRTMVTDLRRAIDECLAGRVFVSRGCEIGVEP